MLQKLARVSWQLPYFGMAALSIVEALGDDLHGCGGRLVEAGITANFPTDAFTLIAQHLAYAFQLPNFTPASSGR